MTTQDIANKQKCFPAVNKDYGKIKQIIKGDSIRNRIMNPKKIDFSLDKKQDEETEKKIRASFRDTTIINPKISKKQKAREIRKAIDSGSISELYTICCGIDIHKDILVATLRTMDSNGKSAEETREYCCFTDALLEFRKWLLEKNCQIVALESTGVYWRPVHNVLEGHMEVLLVNARHFKNVPGRKTDVNDSRWLAMLLQFGLLRGSFIPAVHVRDWRELTRNRKKITKNIQDYKRRVHKVFETANIKIDSVVSDLFGVTGRNLMNYLCETEKITLEGVIKCAKGSLCMKTQELYRAIQGFFRDHHRFEIQSFLEIIACLQEQIEKITVRIHSLMRDQHDLLKRLDEIPGIDKVSAQAVLGELGTDLSDFISPDALCAWAGVAPGNNESAGKRYSGKSPVRKHAFKEILVEIAWSAIKKKGSFYKTKYYNLKARRGAKKAIVAIAHRILKAIYYIIKEGVSYQELGEGYLIKKNADKKMYYLKRQAKALGFELMPISA